MPPVFSAQAAGICPHCVADHDHVADARKMVLLQSNQPAMAGSIACLKAVHCYGHPLLSRAD